MKIKVISYVLMALTIYGLYRLLDTIHKNSGIQILNYGSLMEIVETGSIKEITFWSDGSISGELKNPKNGKTKFNSRMIPLSMTEIGNLRDKIKSRNADAKLEIKIKNELSFFSFLSFLMPFFILLAFFLMMHRSVSRQTSLLDSFSRSRARLSNQQSERVMFEDVAGIDEAKEELKEVVEFLKDPKKFTKLGAQIPKGVLLIGPPGTGKTYLARAVAGEADVPFYSIAGSDFVEMFVGVGAGRARNLFDQAKKNAPCIIFIDELDAVGRHRGTSFGGTHDEREQTLNQILVEMDGFNNNNLVIVIGATNRPDVLDPALLRPGRFDRRVVIDKPDVKGRTDILKVHVKKLPRISINVDLEIVARGTPGFTGADLKNLINEAALIAAKNNQDTIDMECFEKAKDKVLMGTERKSLVISDEEKRTIAYHEAGHTTLALYLSDADPLHKVTIIPRGMSMGSTWQLPKGDAHIYSKEYLKTRLAILMGGRASEQIFLSQCTTGANNDIDKATDLARQMVCEWGMSNLGPLKLSNDSEHPFLGKQLSEISKNYSEKTAQEIDKAVKDLVIEAENTALKILNEKRITVERIAQKLIEKETLDAKEIQELKN